MGLPPYIVAKINNKVIVQHEEGYMKIKRNRMNWVDEVKAFE